MQLWDYYSDCMTWLAKFREDTLYTFIFCNALGLYVCSTITQHSTQFIFDLTVSCMLL